MSAWPLRLVHASDFHLERLPRGLPDIPESLRPRLIDAAYLAAERVFDTAVGERAQMLVLSGDVAHPAQAGPRAAVFLVEQFERLATAGIQVYWAAGRVDTPSRWPASVAWPGNVHCFSPGDGESLIYPDHEQPQVAVLGNSAGGRVLPGKFHRDDTGLFTLAVAHGKVPSGSLKQQEVHYLALGGLHQRRTRTAGGRIAHYPGTSQGRSFREAGPCGCTVVEIDGAQRAQLRFVPTDVLRFTRETVPLAEIADRSELETTLRSRVEAVLQSAVGRDVLIQWHVAGDGPLARALRLGELKAELLAWLRGEYGQPSADRPAAWSAAIHVEPPATLPEVWYCEETLLGDFLRQVRQHQQDTALPIVLDEYLPEEYRHGALGAAAALDDPQARDALLREVAVLGADLLGADLPASGLPDTQINDTTESLA